MSSFFFSLLKRGGRGQRRANTQRFAFISRPFHVPRALPEDQELLPQGPSLAGGADDLDFLGRSSQCLADSAGRFHGPGIVKAVCPCDATRGVGAFLVKAERAGSASLQLISSLFLCLGGKKSPSAAHRAPGSPPRDVWSTVGALGKAARAGWQQLSSDVSAPGAGGASPAYPSRQGNTSGRAGSTRRCWHLSPPGCSVNFGMLWGHCRG